MESQHSQNFNKAINFTWTDDFLKLFVDLLLGHQAKYGKKQAYRWKELGIDFSSKSGKPLSKDTLRNKYESMKREYKAWLLLRNAETGLGWDPVTRRITASDEWWEMKIKEDHNCRKFRFKGMTADYEDLLASVFEGAVATGRFAWTPSMDPSHLPIPETREDENQGIDDLEDCGDDFFHNFIGTVGSQVDGVPPVVVGTRDNMPVVDGDTPTSGAPARTRPSAPKRKRKPPYGSSRIEEHLAFSRSNGKRMLELYKEDITARSNIVEEGTVRYISIVEEMLDNGLVDEYSDLWYFALDMNRDNEKRGIFLAIAKMERRLAYLKREFERSQRSHFNDF